MTWCVQWTEGGKTFQCELASQPTKRPPVYRDSMKTLCDHYVILSHGTVEGDPTCPDCIAVRSRRRS